MKRLLILILLVAAPLSAQTIPADFHQWFNQHVAGQPFGQQTLLNLESILPCVGSALTPPNAVGERTKIFDPTTGKWTRVGFGEGFWVWIAQGDGQPPTVPPCTSPPVLPGPPTVPTAPGIDATLLLARLDSIIAQNERIYADVANRLNLVTQRIEAHDQKPSGLEAVLTSKTFWASIIGAISSCAATQCWK